VLIADAKQNCNLGFEDKGFIENSSSGYIVFV
jgi:hypothetical protein